MHLIYHVTTDFYFNMEVMQKYERDESANERHSRFHTAETASWMPI